MKISQPFAVIVFSLLTITSPAQSLLYHWSKTFNTVDMGASSCWGKMAHQSNGNILQLNWINGQQTSIDIDPGADEFLVTSPSNSIRDYLLCLDADGNFQWASILGSGGYVTGMAVDFEDNIYITGYFYEDFVISDGKNNIELTSIDPQNLNLDAGYVVKLNSTGSFQWIRRVSDYGAIPVAATINIHGNLVIAGEYYPLDNEVNDIDPGPDVIDLNTVDQTRGVFAVELDPSDGSNLHYLNFANLEILELGALSIDENEHLWLSGMANQILDLDPGQGEVLLQNTVAGADNFDFLASYDWSGNLLHGMKLAEESTVGSSVRDPLPSVTRGNRIYVASNGALSGDIDPGDGTFELDGSTSYILALDTSGNFVWANAYESASIKDIAITANNNPILLGGYSNTLELNPDSPTGSVTSLGGFDIYFVSFKSTNGQVDRISTLGADHSDISASMSFSSGGQMAYCGCFQGDIDLRPGFGYDNFDAGGDYDYNSFITALSYYYVGLEEFNHPFQALSIYPNPANEEVNILLADRQDELESIRFFDASGKEVLYHKTVRNQSDNLDVSMLASGIYTMQIVTKKSIYSHTLVVK